MLEFLCILLGAIALIVGLAKSIVWLIVVGIILLAVGGVWIFMFGDSDSDPDADFDFDLFD